VKFENLASYRKGRIGEQIVDDWLIADAWVPYRPQEGVAHPFDRLMASRDKQRLCIVEVKTKPHRNAYMDTGINRSHFGDYGRVTIKHDVPLFLAFVDENTRSIYGNWWTELLRTREADRESARHGCTSYPWFHGGQVYFQLAIMRTIKHLNDQQCGELRALRKTAWVDTAEGAAVSK
jgi:hypothetical protein